MKEHNTHKYKDITKAGILYNAYPWGSVILYTCIGGSGGSSPRAKMDGVRPGKQWPL